MSNDRQKITPEQAAAGVRFGEELFLKTCPHCNGVLALYISRDTTHVAGVTKSVNPPAESLPRSTG